MKKILLICFLLISQCLPLQAAEDHAFYALDPQTGQIFANDNVDEKMAPASLTKLLTAYTALQTLEANDVIDINSKMVANLGEASVAGLQAGDSVTVKDLLYALILPSGADAANALAIGSSGSVSRFVKKMNQTAQKLKMTHSHFTTPIGLEEESTARDMMALLQACYQNKTLREVMSSKSYTLSNGLEVYSTIHSYGVNTQAIAGGKTGYTEQAGRCLAAFSEPIQGHVIFSVFLGGSEHTSHVEQTQQLYETIGQYRLTNLMTKGKVLKTIQLKGLFSNPTIKVKANRDLKWFIPSGTKIHVTFVNSRSLEAPIKKGEKLGAVTISVGGNPIASVPVKSSVDLVDYGRWLQIALFILLFIVLLGIVALFWLRAMIRAKRRKRRRARG